MEFLVPRIVFLAAIVVLCLGCGQGNRYDLRAPGEERHAKSGVGLKDPQQGANPAEYQCEDHDDERPNRKKRRKWVKIAGGDFLMGSPDGVGHPEEQPQHLVTVRPFAITRSEITVREYSRCKEDGVCTVPNWAPSCNWNVSGRDRHPINCIDWWQASTYCEWVGGRLPTEAEWEYAVRGGGQDVLYPWGDDEATCDYAVMNDGGAGCGKDHTGPVCSKPKGNTTVYNLCDMAGNVWEWVLDKYHSTYDGAPVDGSAREDPWTTDARPIRGGSWAIATSERLRVASRLWADPRARSSLLGFRCARPAD